MKISAIIPTFKPQEYLWECLDSMATQTFPKGEFEVIIVLNGCKEPYEERIIDYLSQYPELQVVFIQTNQGGVSNARNLALDVARGEYITFIDDDDFVSPTFLEELYSCSDEETIGLCYLYAFLDGFVNNQIELGMNKSYKRLSHNGKQKFHPSRKYFSPPWAKLIPKKIIQERRFDISFTNSEDSLFMFLISDKYKYVQFTSESAIYYRRIRENSAMTSRRSIWKILSNSVRFICACTKIYYDGGQYCFNFFITRILASIKLTMVSIIKYYT